VQPTLVHVDLGPITEWGAPTEPATRDRWPDYHSGAVWTYAESRSAEVCFIDGRFRVASALQALLHVRPDPVILVHDFPSRAGYHVIRDVAREIASAGQLSAFIPRPGRDVAAIEALLDAHRFQPA
jgi:hypothetical protein